MAITLENVAQHVDLDPSDLNKQCTEDDLKELSLEITNWEMYAPFLRLSEADIEDIKSESTNNRRRTFLALLRWKDNNLSKATYKFLANDVFLRFRNAKLAEKVCLLLKRTATGSERRGGTTAGSNKQGGAAIGSNRRGGADTERSGTSLRQPSSAKLPARIDPLIAANFFRGKSEKLKLRLSSNVYSIAGELYSKFIISRDAHEAAVNENHGASIRTANLLRVVEAKIEEEPNVFRTFVQILESEPSQRPLAAGLVEGYNMEVVEIGHHKSSPAFTSRDHDLPGIGRISNFSVPEPSAGPSDNIMNVPSIGSMGEQGHEESLQQSHLVTQPHQTPLADPQYHGASVTLETDYEAQPAGRPFSYDSVFKPLTDVSAAEFTRDLLKLDQLFPFRGNGIHLAILEAGYYESNKSLEGKHIKEEYFSKDLPQFPTVHLQHGTMVAGVAAGREFGDNIKKYPGGVAPAAEVTVFFIDHTHDSIYEALNKIAESSYEVVCMSFGCDPTEMETEKWMKLEQVIRKLDRKGTFLFAAAGNRGDTCEVEFPACVDEVISVASLTKGGKPSDSANEGGDVDVFCFGEVVAPNGKDEGLGFVSGSSAAAPAVSGLACLALDYANCCGCKDDYCRGRILSKFRGRKGTKIKNGSFLKDVFTVIDKCKN